MNAKLIKAIFFMMMGVTCIVVGMDMKYKMNQWSETSNITTNIPGTKTSYAAIGAGTGAAGGGVLAALVGGVGIVFCGTGVGLPAGAGIIAVAALMGGTAGGITGAALGTSSTTTEKAITILQSAHAYEPWQWITLLTIGTALLGFAAFEIRNSLKV